MVSRAGTLFVVATPIGNLEDITGRALRVLREVSLIAAEDTRRTAQLLARYAISTPLTSLHEHNESMKTASLVNRLRAGDSIALVSDAGTPTVSDPGQRFIRTSLEQGLRVETIPGPSAVIAALAVSGFPTDCFTFLGFPPARSQARVEWFERLRASGGTVVFFEAPHRLRRTLEQLSSTVGDCQIFVARELTKAHEELVTGPISEALRRFENPRGEFTIVADTGSMPKNGAPASPRDAAMLDEFGHIIEKLGLSRRHAIKTLANKYSTTANEVYKALERAKKSGK